MADALLEAVIEPRRKGAIDRIKEACAAGADPNRICPETSSSHGLVRGGTTLLTYAISQENVRVVETLLECGASPDLADRLGWTPWMASTAIDESKRARMQSLLAQFGATTSGEHIGTLARAIFAGDVVRAESLIVSNEDPKILSTFRVDLVARQVATRNESMLALLLATQGG
ncbi:MAG: ankyrin repeat domain-containing protein [Pseudomonadota bacterium]